MTVAAGDALVQGARRVEDDPALMAQTFMRHGRRCSWLNPNLTAHRSVLARLWIAQAPRRAAAYESLYADDLAALRAC